MALLASGGRLPEPLAAVEEVRGCGVRLALRGLVSLDSGPFKVCAFHRGLVEIPVFACAIEGRSASMAAQAEALLSAEQLREQLHSALKQSGVLDEVKKEMRRKVQLRCVLCVPRQLLTFLMWPHCMNAVADTTTAAGSQPSETVGNAARRGCSGGGRLLR